MRKYGRFMAALSLVSMLLACGKPEERVVNVPEDSTEEPADVPDAPGDTDVPGDDDEPGNGELRFLGSIADGASFTYDHAAHEGVDIGYWYAQVRSGDGDWETREASEASNAAFYKDVRFTVTDKATGKEADWCSIGYGSADGVINSTHWILSLGANTGTAARIALVTAGFPSSVEGYSLLPGLGTHSIEIVQNKELAPGEIIGEMTFANITSRGGEYGFGPDAVPGQNLFYDAVQIRIYGSENWQTIEASADETIYGGIGISVIDDASGSAATWCRVLRRERDTWFYAVLESNSGAVRSATVTLTFPSAAGGYRLLDGEGSFAFRIRQEAGK